MHRPASVVIVGGGAAGLTAALFLGRAGIQVEVIDQDRSILKRAHLNNLPGSHGLEGRTLLADLRNSLGGLEVTITKGRVEDVVPGPDGFAVDLGDDTIGCRYVVLATGQGTLKLPSLPVHTTDARQPFVKVNVVTDRWGATAVSGVWAAGVVAGWPSQATVCMGSGANVAVEIISTVNGEFWVDHDDTQLSSDAE